MVEKNLQTEIFLELVLSVGGETNETLILKKSIPLYLRKLNCFLAGVLKNTENGQNELMLIPFIAGKSREWLDVKNHFAKRMPKDKESYTQYLLEGSYYYAFCLNGYGNLILGRKKPFDNTFIHELQPVVNHLGKMLIQANNIEQRIKAEEALRESEDRLSKLLINTPLPICYVNKDGVMTFRNDRFIEVFGYTEVDVPNLAEWWQKAYPDKEYRNWVIQNWESAVKNAKETNSDIKSDEYRVTCKDGSIREIIISGTTFNDNFLATFVDITERKESEERIKRFSRIFEDSLNEIYLFDSETLKFIQVNNAAHQNLGYTMEELKNMTPLNFKPEFTRESFEKLIAALHKGEKEKIYFETVHQRKDKSLYNVEVHLQLLKFDQDEIFAAIILDITNRKKAEEELLREKQFLEAVFDSISEGIVACNSDGVLTRFNKATKEFHGIPEETIPADDWANHYDLFHTDGKTRMRKEDIPLFRALKDGIVQNAEMMIIPKNGIAQSFVANGQIIKDSEGNSLGAVVAMHNITERKKAEKELEKLSSVVKQSFEGIAIADMEGKLIFANRAWVQMHGYKNEKELIGKHLSISHSDEQIKNEIIPFNHKVMENGFHVGEVGHIRKNGHPFPTLMNTTLLKDELGNPYAIAGIAKDISERKKAEKELEAAKLKAEESDRLKSAFLANMSHEIRTPMNGILGFADLLKRPNLTGEEQRKFIKIIETSGARMLNIINDIIDISKIESAQVEINLKESNINDQIEYIYTFFKPEAETKGIKFSFNNPLPKKDVIILTDKEKVYAILTNLVKNAIKYTYKGSIKIGYEIKDNNLEFYVRDTGIGIQANRLAAIFDRFVQADIDDIDAREGAGLGLAITKAYVEILSGNIWVESEERVGSCFYFTLPYNVETKEKDLAISTVITDEAENEINPEVSGLKILIAEDDETSEMLISIIVEKYGKEILKVRNGPGAIDACRNNPDIDLVLMDIRMPGMNGYEATKLIRKFNKDVVIIAQTAYGLEGDREKSIAAGCNDYISKPINIDTLNSLILEYFNK